LLGDRRISVKGCLSVSRDVLKSARDLCELATGTFVPTGRDSGLVACWAGYRAARCGPLYVNVDRAVVSAAPLTAGQERLLAFAVGFETGPKLVSAKTTRSDFYPRRGE
jgi:hypothetical protein